MKAFDKRGVISWAVSLALILLLAAVAVWSVGGMGTILKASAAGPAGVTLGAAGNFTILAKSGISTTGSTVIVGDIGVSPAPATYITGFALMLPAVSAFSTSAQISGKVYAPDYADPAPANLTTAVLDMQNAYTDASERAATVTELGAGTIGGLTLAPGVYKWSTGVTIPADLTLSGGASDTWIFEVAQNLTISSSVKIVLSGGAQASNIFWVVGGQTTLGTNAVFNGTILDQTAIILNTGAQLNGRALAQTAVTMDSNMVIMPPPSSGSGASMPIYTSTSTPTYTSMPTDAFSLGQAIVLGNGQMVYVHPNGSFTNVQGQPIANTAISTAIPAINFPSTGGGSKAFAQDLWMGTTGTDVQMLQQYLNSHGYMVAASGSGSVGNETTTFGALTQAALIKFQTAVGISPAVGYFGPVTRSYINTQY